MLGADGPRTYLLLFTTPSESRGLGGFIGSYAELRVDDGTADARRVRARPGPRSADPGRRRRASTTRTSSCAQYGRFGFDVDGTGTGLVGDSALRNLAMTPDFPTVAEIAADLYAADDRHRRSTASSPWTPYVVTQLLRYTGRCSSRRSAARSRPDEALPFLLRDQYLVDVPDDQRADGLAEAAASGVRPA